MRRFAGWLFATPAVPTSAMGAVTWWEARRIAFNAIVGVYGALCLAIFFWALSTSGKLDPGDDAIEPLALIAAPIVINILSTLGWLVEVPARLTAPALTPRFGPLLMKLGLGFGMFMITLPAGFWLGYRILQCADSCADADGFPQPLCGAV